MLLTRVVSVPGAPVNSTLKSNMQLVRVCVGKNGREGIETQALVRQRTSALHVIPDVLHFSAAGVYHDFLRNKSKASN
jgi:hypothetical protein